MLLAGQFRDPKAAERHKVAGRQRKQDDPDRQQPHDSAARLIHPPPNTSAVVGDPAILERRGRAASLIRAEG
jgi:hypothetical protein